jgi:acetyltransferase-like isoleucine patch superfamily enzyme
MPGPSRQKLRVLAGRARAELRLRRPGNRGRLRYGGDTIFYDAMPALAPHGRISTGVGFSIYGSPIPAQITAAEGAAVAIGDSVTINYGADIYAARSIEIGDAAMIGTLVSIYDTNFHPVDEGGTTKTEAVRIGDNVWIGRGATILPGVEIGDHAVVAAGSVVVGEVPARTVVAGNPATVRRELTASDGWRRNAEVG